MKKYRLTDECIETITGVKIHRIISLIDFGGVKAGEIGGYIQSEANLSHDDECWVSGDAQVSGDAWVYGNAWVYGDAWVSGDARVSGNAQVYGNAWVSGDAWVSGNARVYGDAWDVSPLQIQGTKYFVNMADANTLKMGCQEHSIKKWLKHGPKIAEECNETDLWPEYKLYVELAAKRYAPGLLGG